MAYSSPTSIQSLLPIISSYLLVLSLSFFNTDATVFKPKALVLPVTKDAKTHQYLTHIYLRTPQVPVKLVVHLGGTFLWIDCDTKDYVSSSYKAPYCRGSQCALAGESGLCSRCFSPPRPGCNNHTCRLLPDNAISGVSTNGELATDVVSIQSTDGSNPGKSVTIRQLLFVCVPTFLLEKLSTSVQGMAGLGRSKIGLPSLFSAAFNFTIKFAICLTSSTTSKGVIFFGDGPYNMLPRVDVSSNLTYTPLLINPVSTAGAYSKGDASTEYFIGVSSIKINGKAVPLNPKLLSIRKKDGYGGTKISTVDPYTIMETSIYNAITNAFAQEAKAMSMSRVASVPPFGVCFSRKNVPSSRVGYSVPTIDLVFQDEKTYWRIFGSNSMVQVSENVLCLGFVDGGLKPLTSIVIGGYQLEDNLLQFDIEGSRLGFSSTILSRQTTCSNFNFTAT